MRLGSGRPGAPDSRAAGPQRDRPAAALPYMPAVDGLRALSVTAVILYHAGVSWLPGGFFGVEVFFVISGFLITSLLRAEYQKTGRVSLVAFWGRRARRLLPGVWFLMASVCLLVVALLPGEWPSLAPDVGAGMAYVTNWWLVVEEKSYFAQAGRPSLLTHLWSLAIEEQFYLLWPPLFAFALARLRPRRAAEVLIGLSLLSAAWAAWIYDPDVDPSRLYYGTDTRACGLLLGCAFAFLVSPVSSDRVASGAPLNAPFEARVLRRWDWGGGIALAMLVAACVVVNEYNEWLYHGMFVLVALASIAVIVPASAVGQTQVARLLGASPLAALGRRSYSLYLWHWPIFMITRPGIDVPIAETPLLPVRLLLVLGLAELSYRCVETPIRSKLGRARLGQGLSGPVPAVPRPVAASVFVLAGIAVLAVAAPRLFLKPQALEGYGSAIDLAAEPPPDAHSSAKAVASSGPAPQPLAPFANSAAAPVLAALATDPLKTVEPPEPSQPDSGEPDGRDVKPRDWDERFRKPRRVLAFGDSVMLGARSRLYEKGIGVEIDAVPGRQTSHALKRLLKRRKTGGLAPVVIVHLGNNGTFRQRQFDRMMYLLKPVQTVVFVTAQVPRRWQAPNNQVMAEGVARYPNTVLLDWERFSRDRVGWFAGDGYHLAREGGKAYAEVIKSFYYYPSPAEWAKRKPTSDER
ncbi:MAG: acyltransferase family protein [Myxococcales bacterium]|nr:acyltransferase family protein [Myxococcales bacterium]